MVLDEGGPVRHDTPTVGRRGCMLRRPREEARGSESRWKRSGTGSWSKKEPNRGFDPGGGGGDLPQHRGFPQAFDPHPDGSFRAGVALCKAAVSTVVRNMPPSSSSPEEVAEISLAVQEIVMDRLSRMVTASFVDYLLTKVRETQSEESRRFSSDLHDRLAHEMTVVVQSLQLHEALARRDLRRAKERLDLARQTAANALELMREFARELREIQTSDGLRIALENLMRISVPGGVKAEVLFEGEEEHMPD